jgi:hypothetical protein
MWHVAAGMRHSCVIRALVGSASYCFAEGMADSGFSAARIGECGTQPHGENSMPRRKIRNLIVAAITILSVAIAAMVAGGAPAASAAPAAAAYVKDASAAAGPAQGVTHATTAAKVRNASTVIPATVTHSACDGDFGTIFDPMSLCLHFTINGSGAHVNYFRAEVCVYEVLAAVNYFHGHVEFKGKSGDWNTGNMTVTVNQCKTGTVHVNRDVTPGGYTAKAWQNNGNGNYRDEVNVTDNVV